MVYLTKIKFWTVFLGMCLVLVGAAENIVAQNAETEKRNIKGYVKDAESGEALPYANVLLKGTYIGASTNVDGYFVIVNVPVGIDTLQVSYIGYAFQDVPVNNVEVENDLLDIRLTPISLLLDEIVVQGKVDMVEVSHEAGQITVSPQQLTVLPNFGEVDVFRSLQLLPGISAVNDGSSGLYVRGGTPDQNLVLLDGMKIYHVDHFFGFFSAFNADAVKDIKMYKGGFPAKYGGRVSSVVDITGKTGNVNRFSMGAGVNLLNGNVLFEVPLSDDVNWLLAVRRSYTDFMRSSLYNSIYDFFTGDDTNTQVGTFRPRGGGRFGGGNVETGSTVPAFYFYDLNSKLTWTPTAKDILALSIYNGIDNLDQSQDFGGLGFRLPGSEGNASLSTSTITEWGNTGISGKWSHRWNDRIYSNVMIARSTYFSNYDRSTSFDFDNAANNNQNVARGFGRASEEDNKVKDLTFLFDNELHLTNSHRVDFGFELSQFDARYKTTLNDTTSLFSRETEASQSSFFIQENWKPFRLFELTAGIRGTYYDQTDTRYIEPRASFVVNLTDPIHIKGAWGKYNQFVNRVTNENVLEGSRDFWLLADDELKPTAADHYILGLSYENDDYLFDIEGYYKDLDNLLEYTQRVGRNTTVNNPLFMGTGTSQGVEFLLQKKRGMVTGWAGYTVGNVEHLFPELNNGNTFPADNDRRHEINFVGTVSKGPWDFSATWVFASGKAYTSPVSQYYLTLLDGSELSYIHVSDKNANRLPAYHRLDMSVSHRFVFDTWNLDFGASVFNAYNNENVFYKEYNLDATPVVVTDILMLGFTPTIYARFSL